MLNKIILIFLIIFPSISYAKSEYQALRELRNKTYDEAVACSKEFKKLNDDKKFECLTKSNNLNSLNIKMLQEQLLELQLNTTGH